MHFPKNPVRNRYLYILAERQRLERTNEICSEAEPQRATVDTATQSAS